MRKWLAVAIVAVAAPVAGASFLGVLLVRSGLSARPEPHALEAALARQVRSLAGRPNRGLKNPVLATKEAIGEGLSHFADHCAQCHGNDGSGRTELGQHLYPRAPDMRLPATQALTDGELFGVIQNGVRMTGMPAWGDGSTESAAASWQLVHFLRHLPQLSDEESAQMQRLNPKGPEEWHEQEAEEKFLEPREQPDPAPGPHP